VIIRCGARCVQPPKASQAKAGSDAEGGASKEKAKATKAPATYEEVLAEVMKMKVGDMKKELDVWGVSHQGFFEKGEFAQALAQARVNPTRKPLGPSLGPVPLT
jgi:hypothetical protein